MADCSISISSLQGQVLRSKAPKDSNKFERGVAMALRSFVLLLAAYVFFYVIFPINLLGTRLGDVTVGEFLLVIFRTLVAATGAIYLIIRALQQPDLQDRDRIWCERWSGLAFGVIAIISASILVAIFERKGVKLTPADWMARGVLWLLF